MCFVIRMGEIVTLKYVKREKELENTKQNLLSKFEAEMETIRDQREHVFQWWSLTIITIP